MHNQLRNILVGSVVAVLLVVLSSTTAFAAPYAAAHTANSSNAAHQLIRQGVPSGCYSAELNTPDLSAYLVLTYYETPENDEIVSGSIYEYVFYNSGSGQTEPCNYYYATVTICPQGYTGDFVNGAIWLYNAGGTYLASTPTPWVLGPGGGDYCVTSGATNTVYSATGIKARLGAQVDPNYGYITTSLFPSSGTYHF